MKIAGAVLVALVTAVGSAHGTVPLCGDDGSGHPGDKQAPAVFSEAQKPGARATCPVSGEQFTIREGTRHAEYKGKHVYFCCPGCKDRFDKDPDKYINRGS